MNKSIMGWIVAGVLAVVLVGVVVFQSGSGTGTRSAKLGSDQAQGPPSDVAADTEKIKADKEAKGKDKLPRLEAGQEGTRLQNNPERICDPNLPPNVSAEWRNNPTNMNQAAGLAKRAVVGTVEEVTDGAALSADAPGEPGGRVETPTQQIRIRVDDAVRGGGSQGETITVESLGDGERGCYRVAGDPPYRRGEQYLLLLEDGKGGRPAHTISSAGRFRVGPDAILQAMEDNPNMSDTARQKLSDVVAKLKARG